MDKKHDKRHKREFKKIITAVGIILLIAFVWLLLKGCGQEKEISPSFSYIKEKAKELDFDVDKIVAFIEQDVRTESYEGYLRGPVGTLWSRGGSDIDQCSLLSALLEYTSSKTKLMRDSAGYFLQYKRQGEWSSFYPISGISMNKELKDELVDSIPDSIRHKLGIIIRAYSSNKVTDDIIFKSDTASFINSRNILMFEKSASGKIFPILVCGNRKIRGKNDIKNLKRLDLIFEEYPAGSKDKKIYSRTIFDNKRQVGHLKGDLRDTYVFIISPNFVGIDVFKKETELFDKAKKDMSTKEYSIGRNYLLGISFITLSDINTKELLKKINAEATFRSPRIIIASKEYEKWKGIDIPNQTLDLLKNDISIDSSNVKEVNTMRCIGDNLIEGFVLNMETKEKCVTTASLFNKLFEDDFGYINDTLLRRAALYLDNIEKMISTDDDIALTIDSGEYSLGIRKDQCQGQRRINILLSKKGYSSLKENLNPLPEFLTPGFVYKKDIDKYYLDCSKKKIEDIPVILETIFIKGFGIPSNYMPFITRNTAAKDNKLLFSENDKLVYSIRKGTDQCFVTAFLRKKGKRLLMEWNSPHGKKINHYEGLLPMATQNLSPYIFNDTLNEIGSIWANIGQDRKKDWGSNHWKGVNENLELIANADYSIFLNNHLVKFRTNLWANSNFKIWILDDKDNPLVVKVETSDSIQEIQSISNGIGEYVVCGKISDDISKQGINNAKISISGDNSLSKNISTTTWGDGSFDLNFQEPAYIIDNSVFLFLDNSGSMEWHSTIGRKGYSRMELTRKAAVDFINVLPTNTEMLVEDFTMLSENYDISETIFTIDKTKSKHRIAAIDGDWGGTPLTRSIYKIFKIMKQASGRYKRVILLSDGDNTNDGTMLKAYKETGCDIPFYTVGFGVDKDSDAKKQLKEIAEFSGGRYLSASSLKDLDKAFLEFSKMPVEKEVSTVIVSAKGYKKKEQDLLFSDSKDNLTFVLEREDGWNTDKILIVSSKNLSELYDLNIREQAKEMVSAAVTSNKDIRVIIPTKMIDFNIFYGIGWWELNLKTGEFIGLTEDGLHGSTMNFVPNSSDIEGFVKDEVDGCIDKTRDKILGSKGAELSKFGSLIAGMYCQVAGILSGIEKAEFDSSREMTLLEWAKTVEEESFVFSDAFLKKMRLLYNAEFFKKGVKSVAGVFKSSYAIFE